MKRNEKYELYNSSDVFSHRFKLKSKTCDRCRRWHALRRKAQRDKAEPQNIRKARQIWDKVDSHTRRRVLACFTRLYTHQHPVTVQSLTCVMPEVVWTLSVEDLRDVWNAYRTSKKSSEREGQTIAPLSPPSPPITIQHMTETDTPDSPASRDVRSKTIRYLQSKNSLLMFQARVTNDSLSHLLYR
mgnify:CR=1 FL=1